MPYRAQRGDRRVVEPDIAAARRQPHRLEIVHAADAHAAVDDVSRHAELALPIGRQRYRSEMAARGLVPDIEPVRVAAKPGDILVDPGDRAAHLIGEQHQIAADVLYPGEIGHHVMRPGAEEHLGRYREILRAAAAPCAAMDEDKDRRRYTPPAVDA